MHNGAILAPGLRFRPKERQCNIGLPGGKCLDRLQRSNESGRAKTRIRFCHAHRIRHELHGQLRRPGQALAKSLAHPVRVGLPPLGQDIQVQREPRFLFSHSWNFGHPERQRLHDDKF
jgi:hypothetical protein